jgi:hypothetical protein
VIKTSSRTKLLLAGGGALVALIGIVAGPMIQSAANTGAALASAAPPFAAPNSPPSPTPASNPASPQNSGPCGCGDIREIEERIREASAVIPLYQAEINKLQANAQQANAPVPPYSSQQYNQFQSSLQPVLNALAQQNGVSTFANGDTSMFCNVTPNLQASACMQASTLKHESVHSAVCKQYGWSLSAGTWKQQIGLVAVYQNEINAYQAELDFLQPLLAALKPSCSVGWSGVITSHFASSTRQNSPMPPMKPGLRSESSTLARDYTRDDNWTFNGLIGQVPQFTQGTWLGTLTSSYSLFQDSAFPLGNGCAGKILRGHGDLKDTGNGSGSGRATLIVTVTGAVAHISVQGNANDPPGQILTAGMQQNWADIVQNDCGHRVTNGSPAMVPGASEPFTQTGVDFDAPADPQYPGILKGHLAKPLPPDHLGGCRRPAQPWGSRAPERPRERILLIGT